MELFYKLNDWKYFFNLVINESIFWRCRMVKRNSCRIHGEYDVFFDINFKLVNGRPSRLEAQQTIFWVLRSILYVSHLPLGKYEFYFQTYIKIILNLKGSLLIFKSLLPYLINLILYSGFFGVSFSICILIDVFSLLTIHTTCFYVYANRIYKLELESLKSLFRLFRGKKFNPLRNRIDSYSFNIEQLFIGTLGFCLTFFLLPTVIVYYAVFLIVYIS